jgi:hypothetical protein
MHLPLNILRKAAQHPVLLVEETRVPRKNHRPVASHWQTLSHNVYIMYMLTMNRVRTHNTDCVGSCKSNYQDNSNQPKNRVSKWVKVVQCQLSKFSAIAWWEQVNF